MTASDWIRRATLGAALVCMITAPVQSQDSAAGGNPWLAAFSVGLPVVDGETSLMLFTIGANFTGMRPGVLSPDLGIGTMPYAVLFGLVPVGIRAGAALPMQATPDLFIVPSAGVSLLGSLGAFSGGVRGINAGLALVTRTGTRFGLTWHRFSETERVMLLEIGVGRLRK